ncbi:MAG TPA: glycosyltransferase family 2 protein [Acidimicrobiales bacterium]|nr:glycosyltransferase family 2 protein [Acidimicrobiales bacterium]
MAGTDDVAAVVVNYNVRDHLLACVRSLRDEGVSDVVVVDNDSRDGSGAALAAADPDARFIAAGANLGFGTAANRGVVATDASRVLILNPDTVVEPGCVKALLAALESDDGLAAVGPRVDNPDGTRYPSVRRFPDLGVAAGHAFLGLVRPGNRFTRRYRMLDHEPDRAGDVDWVSGTCMLVRRSAFEAVGGFDEAYFMYVEDVDLCWRLQQVGWRVGYEPKARVVHTVGASSERAPYRMIAAHHRSLLRFAVRSTTGARRLVLPFVAVGLAVRTVLAWAQRAWRGVPHAMVTAPRRRLSMPFRRLHRPGRRTRGRSGSRARVR